MSIIFHMWPGRVTGISTDSYWLVSTVCVAQVGGVRACVCTPYLRAWVCVQCHACMIIDAALHCLVNVSPCWSQCITIDNNRCLHYAFIIHSDNSLSHNGTFVDIHRSLATVSRRPFVTRPILLFGNTRLHAISYIYITAGLIWSHLPSLILAGPSSPRSHSLLVCCAICPFYLRSNTSVVPY